MSDGSPGTGSPVQDLDMGLDGGPGRGKTRGLYQTMGNLNQDMDNLNQELGSPDQVTIASDEEITATDSDSNAPKSGEHYPETLDPTFDDKWDIREPVIKPGHDMGDVTSWLYKGNRLPAAPPTIDNNSTDLEITSYYFNRALQSGHNDVLQIVDAHAEKKVIHRLLVMKPVFKHRQRQIVLHHPTRQQQFSAIVGHLFADCIPGEYSACDTCSKSRSEGPFKICVYDESTALFKYACTNCQSKSCSKKCSNRLEAEREQAKLKQERSHVKSKLVLDDQAAPKHDHTTPKNKKRDHTGSGSSNASSNPAKRVRPYPPNKGGLYEAGPPQFNTAGPQFNTAPQRTNPMQPRASPTWIEQTSTAALTTLQTEINQELARRYTQMANDQPWTGMY